MTVGVSCKSPAADTCRSVQLCAGDMPTAQPRHLAAMMSRGVKLDWRLVVGVVVVVASVVLIQSLVAL